MSLTLFASACAPAPVAISRAPAEYTGPLSPIALTHFSVFEYWGNDEGYEKFTRNAEQTGPHTFSFSLKRVGLAPHLMPRAGLLAKDALATQRMTETLPNPISLEQKRELDAVSGRIESERTLYVEFNRRSRDLMQQTLISLLKLVKGDLPVRRGPEHEALEFRPAPLPWMLDPALRKLAATVNRGRGHEELIYELSRGTNIEDPELFRYSFAFLVREAVRDVAARGGDLRHAYVYGHTIKPETTAYFGKYFPWKPWKEAEPHLPPGQGMFKASLADILSTPAFNPKLDREPFLLHEYFADDKEWVDRLAPGDPVRYFSFEADVGRGQSIYLRMVDADGRDAGLARLRWPRELIDLRVKVACAKHGISEPGFRDRVDDRWLYGVEEGEARPGMATLELAPPKLVHGSQGRRLFSPRKYAFEGIDYTEARRALEREYARLLREWEAVGKSLPELGFASRRDYFAQVRGLALESSYGYRLEPHDAHGDRIEPETFRSRLELRGLRRPQRPEFRLKALPRSLEGR
jgi:hypothetical protein